MSEAVRLLQTLKRHLKHQGRTYRDVAAALRLSEPSVKRLFASGRIRLDRLVGIAAFLGFTLAELVEEAQSAEPKVSMLTAEQEAQLAADPELLLVTVCMLNQWTLEHVVAAYTLSEQEVLRRLLQLDRMGLLELLPGNRVRLRVSRDFDWIPGGPIRIFFRQHCERDFLAGGFEGDADAQIFAQGMLGEAARGELRMELERLKRRFGQWHRESARLPKEKRFGTVLWMATRQWEPAVFRRLRRPVGASPGVSR